MGENLSEYVQLVISEEDMIAELYLNSDADECVFDDDDILEYLAEQGVVCGIDEDKIKHMVESKMYGVMVVVASGRKPVEGRDGYYSYTFETNPDKKPKLREDGSVDYLNLNLLQTVATGDLLARYYPKQDGINGFNIKGKELKAQSVKNIPPLRGKGFTMSEDGIEYYAAYDGKVELSMSGINVTKIATIPGDVGLSIGNIDFKGDLEIMGAILTGMRVKATGNITVNGVIEAAEVTAGKDILVKRGILGGGRARITGGGNVYAQFIENAEIKSGNCVQADSIVNSLVTAYNDVNIFGKKSSIVGGSIKANRMVRTKYIGSQAQILTRIEVGVDTSELSKLRQMELKLKEDQMDLAKVEKAIELTESQKHTPKEMSMLLMRTKIEKTTGISKTKIEIDELKKKIELAKSAEVVAEQMAYQGTIVTIDGITHRLDHDYEKIVLIRKGDKVLSKLFKDDDYEKL